VKNANWKYVAAFVLLCTVGVDAVGAGYQLLGPGLFGGPYDKYVVISGGRLLVSNTQGEVWARNLTHADGPGLFGGPDDKYVVTY
jgi:hypothetical protein